MSALTVNKSPFPTISSTEVSYDSIMDTARKEYNSKYDHYSNKLREIEEKTKEWNNLTSEEIEKLTEADFKKNFLDLYTAQRDVRSGCEKILNIYEEAIAQCEPPLLDPDSLIVLQRLKIKVSDIEASYNKVFVDNLAQLKDQRVKIKALYDKVVPALAAMRKAGEPVANKFYPNASFVNGISGIYNSLTGANTTPSFTKAINARVSTHLLAKASSQPNPETKLEERKTN